MATTTAVQPDAGVKNETWVSQTEAMARCGISYNKLTRHIFNDGLRRRRSGRDKKIILVCLEDLEKLLQDKPVEGW